MVSSVGRGVFSEESGFLVEQGKDSHTSMLPSCVEGLVSTGLFYTFTFSGVILAL